jgi:hypothetical protein
MPIPGARYGWKTPPSGTKAWFAFSGEKAGPSFLAGPPQCENHLDFESEGRLA